MYRRAAKVALCLAVTLGAVSATSCDSSPSWREQLIAASDAMCGAFYSCLSESELEAARPVVVWYGSDVAACRAYWRETYAEQDAACNEGLDFHDDRAASCVPAWEHSNCDNLRRNASHPESTEPEICEGICAPSGS